jgi:PAS domain S-box-containing protein
MCGDRIDIRSREKLLLEENEELRARLAEAEQALQAIRSGEVDALVIDGPQGEQVFSLAGVERVYRVIVETMNEAALTVSPQGAILFCNQRFAHLMKVPLPEIVGRRLDDFVEPASRPALAELMAGALEAPSRRRLLLRPAEGFDTPVQLSGAALTTESGPCICLVATDLSALEAAGEFIRFLEAHQKELIQAREQLSLAKESARLGFYDNDLRTGAKFWDERVRQLWGLDRETAATGAHFWARVHPEDRSAVRSALDHAYDPKGSGEYFAEYRMLSAVGADPVWIASRGRVFFENGKPARFTGALQDISGSKRAELKMRGQAAVLEGINRIFRALLTDQSEERLGQVCLAVAAELTASRMGFVGEVSPDGQLYDIAISNPGWDACRIPEKERFRGPRNAFKIHGIYGRVLREGRSVLTNDPSVEPDRIGYPPGHPTLESFLGVPLQHEGRIVGMIAVGNREGGYRREDQETLEALAPAIVEAFLRLRSEEALRKSEERLTIAKAAAAFGIHDYDPATGTIEWDARVRELWGVGPDEPVTFETFISGVHPDDRPAVQAAVERALDPSGDGRFQAEYRVRNRADGVERWIVATGRASFEDQRAVRLVGTVLDITERRTRENLLRESEGRFRTMADGLPLIVWVHGPDGRQEFINHTFCEFFGVKWEETRAERWQVLMHPEDGAYTTEFLACVRDRREFHAEGRVRRADGEWRWIESFGRPRFSPSGEFLGFVGTSLDVTERKHFDAQLLKTKAHLEEEVAKRTVQLAATISSLQDEIRERKIAEAESTARAKQLRLLAGELTMTEHRERKRLAQVLHDGLQQYLAAAKLQVGGLAGNPTEAKQAATQIEQLLGESIQMSRSLSAELSPPILYERGLGAAFEWLAHMMRERYGLAVACSFQCKPDPPEDMKILLFQSVRELLFNAVKHSGVSAAEVEMQAQDGHLRISVSDSGGGFDPQRLGKIGAGGGGFGLFSIRERLALLGGALEIDSASGRGSRFTMTIPHSTMIREQPPEQAPDREALRILIVDDHSLIREGLTRLCKPEPDLKVVGQAAGGKEAIALAKELKPDVVLMDISMPGMNGIEVTAAIHQSHPEIQIIGLSMYEDHANIQAMRQAGAVDFRSKGCSSSELLAAVRACKPVRRDAGAHGEPDHSLP